MDNDYLKEKLSTFNEDTSLNDLQKYVNEMKEIRGFSKETPQDVMLFLTEEIGELAKEVRKSRKYKMDVNKMENMQLDIEGEIADVFIYILSMCRVMNIDLLEAFKDKEARNCKREWK